MDKPKHKYTIFKNEVQDYGDGRIVKTCEAIGTTWAVSAAKAVSNYCFRNHIYKEQVRDWAYDGCRRTTITAQLA